MVGPRNKLVGLKLRVLDTFGVKAFTAAACVVKLHSCMLLALFVLPRILMLRACTRRCQNIQAQCRLVIALAGSVLRALP